ncbi:MAG: helix-turn-helix domain-containing protein [Myxococcota bacterium]
MIRQSLDSQNCPIAHASEIFADAWTLLILRESFLGTRRFVDFQTQLGVSKNVLTQRLQHLVAHAILAKVDVGTHGRRFEYVLTPKGKDLLTVVTAIRQWGDRWIYEGKGPLVVVDRKTGEPIEPVRIRRKDGTAVPTQDLSLRPGPGASKETLRRFRGAATSRRTSPREREDS